jgi:hypothetical protein
MACNGYLPIFQKQLNPLDPLGGLNCTAYSGAMAAEYHTCGLKRPLGRTVRRMTGDTSGGTTLPQIDYALNRGWGINLDTRIGSSKLTWSQFVSHINSGKGAILQGHYSAIHGTRFQGDLNFTGNHAIFVPPAFRVMDPLCDGRKPGIYKYHSERYPLEMLKRFAGRLLLVTSTGRRLGYGYVWASLTRDNTVVSKWMARVPATVFIKYHVVDGVIQTYRKYETGGFSGSCTTPRNYPAKDGLPFVSRRLVKMTSGSRSGWYVSANYAREN